MRESNEGITKTQLGVMLLLGVCFNAFIAALIYAVWKNARLGLLVALLAAVGCYGTVKWLIHLDAARSE